MSRGADIKRMYLDEGLTLAEIATEYDLSRERIRQVLKVEGVTPRADGRKSNSTRARQHQERLDAAREDPRLVVDLYRQSYRLIDVANLLGITRAEVDAIISPLIGDEERRAYRPVGPGTTATRATDAELLANLREVAAIVGDPFTRGQFDPIARARGWRGWQTYHLRFGSWNQALRLAGLSTMEGYGNRLGSGYWTNETVTAALGLAFAELGRVPTLAEYDEFARGKDAFPSGGTVRMKYGPWKKVLIDFALAT